MSAGLPVLGYPELTPLCGLQPELGYPLCGLHPLREKGLLTLGLEPIVL